MRGLFEFLSAFDWITPAKGFIEDVINDPTLLQSNSWTFFVPYGEALDVAGWNANDIDRLMSDYGIKSWGGQITNGEYFFSVGLKQAEYAEYILLKHGVPLNPKYSLPAIEQDRQDRPQEQATEKERPRVSFRGFRGFKK